MAEHLTEEEQIETIKRWWHDNWLSVVMPIVFALVAYTGWNFWSQNQVAQTAQASEIYEELSVMMQVGEDGLLPEDNKAQALILAEQLRADHADTLYADLSTLMLAKLHFESEALEDAEAALRHVSDTSKSQAIIDIAQTRLVRVLMEQSNFSDALSIIDRAQSSEMKPVFLELRGDIFVAQGDQLAANTSYQSAFDSLSDDQFSHRAILEFKLKSTQSSAQGQNVLSEPQADTEVEAADASAS